jgi:hypothetical protein
MLQAAAWVLALSMLLMFSTAGLNAITRSLYERSKRRGEYNSRWRPSLREGWETNLLQLLGLNVTFFVLAGVRELGQHGGWGIVGAIALGAPFCVAGWWLYLIHQEPERCRSLGRHRPDLNQIRNEGNRLDSRCVRCGAEIISYIDADNWMRV